MSKLIFSTVAGTLLLSAAIFQSRGQQLSQDEQLLLAIRRNDIHKMQAVINRGASLNGTQALHKQKPLDLNQPPPPLLFALGGTWAWKSKQYVNTTPVKPISVNFLINAGANVNIQEPDKMMTPLMLACLHGYPETVALILQHKTHINSKDGKKMTALFAAVMQPKRNNTKIVKLLLENGADPNARADNGSCPLVWVRGPGRLKYIDLLIKHGARINARDKRGRTVLRQLKEDNESFEPPDNDIVEMLQKQGAIE